MMSKGISIGLVVDCTALDLHLLDVDILNKKQQKQPTVRYWHNTNEWDDFDVEYQALTPEVESVTTDYLIPSQLMVQKFITLCNQHWKKRPNTQIAVFDARGGIGAASYLVSSYMCHKMKAPVHVAVASIQKITQESRLPGIYDENLLRSLQKTFRGRKELIVPERPTWAPAILDGDENENDEETEEDTKPSSQTKIIIPPWKEESIKNPPPAKLNNMLPPPPKKLKPSHTPPKSAAVVPLLSTSSKHTRAITVLAQLTNNKIVPDTPTKLQKPLHPYILTCLPKESSTNNSSNANIIHAIQTQEALQSTIRKYSSLLQKHHYMVTWIPNGKDVKRGLLLILQEGIYFLSSHHSSSYYSSNYDTSTIDVEIISKGIFFPRPSKQTQPQHRTLLDGFLIFPKGNITAIPGQSKSPKILFYAFDILTMEGGIVHHKSLRKRIAYLKGGVMEPRKKWKMAEQSEAEKEEIDVIPLEFHEIKGLSEVWNIGKTKHSLTSLGGGGLLFMNMEMSHGEDGFLWMEGQGKLNVQDIFESFKV